MGKFKRKHLAYSFASFSTVFLLSFIASAYPATTIGITLVIFTLICIVVGLGYLEWAAMLRNNNLHMIDLKATLFTSFSGSIVILLIILLAIVGGFYVA